MKGLLLLPLVYFTANACADKNTEDYTNESNVRGVEQDPVPGLSPEEMQAESERITLEQSLSLDALGSLPTFSTKEVASKKIVKIQVPVDENLKIISVNSHSKDPKGSGNCFVTYSDIKAVKIVTKLSPTSANTQNCDKTNYKTKGTFHSVSVYHPSIPGTMAWSYFGNAGHTSFDSYAKTIQDSFDSTAFLQDLSSRLPSLKKVVKTSGNTTTEKLNLLEIEGLTVGKVLGITKVNLVTITSGASFYP